MIDPTPERFDFEADTAPLDWLVDGVVERGTVTILSGDTAAGKTLLASALAVAVIQGGEWLGREVHVGNVLYCDEENWHRLTRDRLRAFGMTNADRPNLRYFQRAGVALGEPAWNRWLGQQAEDHRAALVVVDTASSATAGDLSDNSKTAAVYRDALRPATIGGASVLLLAHERKTNPDYSRNASQATMGARAWIGQADSHIAIAATGNLTSEDAENGRTRQRFPVELETPKVRDGQPALPQRLAIVSERNAEGRLEWMAVQREGEAPAARPSGVDRLLPRIVAAIDGRATVPRAEIATAVALDSKDGHLQRALDEGTKRGLLTKPKYGSYGAPR